MISGSSRLPDNTRLPADGYVAFDERQLGFGLSGSRGDDVYLVSADANGWPQQFVDEVHFGASDAAVSLGRWPDGQGLLFPMSRGHDRPSKCRTVVRRRADQRSALSSAGPRWKWAVERTRL